MSLSLWLRFVCIWRALNEFGTRRSVKWVAIIAYTIYGNILCKLKTWVAPSCLAPGNNPTKMLCLPVLLLLLLSLHIVATSVYVTFFSIWCENMFRDLSVDLNNSSGKQTALELRERSSWIKVRSEERIISKDKYPMFFFFKFKWRLLCLFIFPLLACPLIFPLSCPSPFDVS